MMADNTNNADETVYTLQPQPGIKRDGTVLDGEFCSDGEWVRFQRGKPKKMGGFRRITDQLTGPSRKAIVWTRKDLNSVTSFSSSKIETLLVDNNFVGNDIHDRTPAGFVPSTNNMWTADTQYDDAVGTTGTIILAHCNQSLSNIDDDTGSKPYWALASSATSTFVEITDAPAVSGGVFSLAPYTVLYGSDGLVSWSDANQPQVYSGSAVPGDAGADRVTGAKIVAGLPLRSGRLAALLWSLDSVIRMDWVGGSAIFNFTTASTQSSILAQNSVIEYDGVYYWIGVDRFMYFDSRVQELPNDMNQNWFFDNLNYAQRQKIWATKVPRYGEIWWFYPRGDATECSHAIIFNVRLKTWYDAEHARSSGYYSQVRHHPVWVGGDSTVQLRVASTTNFNVGDRVDGALTQAYGTVVRIDTSSNDVFMNNVSGTFSSSETVTSSSGGSTASIFTDSPGSSSAYQQEIGHNSVIGDVEAAICSSFTTQNFGYPTGGTGDSAQGSNRWTRLTRVEPDFVMEGDMNCYVLSREFAQSETTVSDPYPFSADTEKIDMRQQSRHVMLKFESNTVGGNYEGGRQLVHTEMGDNRS